MSQRLLVTAGLVITGLGIALLVEPALLPIRLDTLFIRLLGFVLVSQAAWVIWNEPADVRFYSDQVSPELPQSVPHPGDDIQAIIDGLAKARGGLVHKQAQLHNRLQQLAIAVIAQTNRIDRRAARQLVRDQEWTEDGIAAKYIAQGLGSTGFLRSITTELVEGTVRRLRLNRPSHHQSEIIHAINAIGALLDMPSLSLESARAQERSDPVTLSDYSSTGSTARTDHGPEGIDPEWLTTGHWTAIRALGFAFAGIGILLGQPAIVLPAVVGIGFSIYAHVPHPDTPNVSIDRDLSADETIHPGDDIHVSLTITNDGPATLFDIRVIDGVPPNLAVISGSPRLGTALRPDESVTMEYTLEGRRGTHEFEATQLYVRSLPGTYERELTVQSQGSISCDPILRATPAPVPLRERAAQFTGNVAARSGGGVEFEAVRGYRPGDPLSRIDWNRHARTGDLTTLVFREERATNVVLVIDTRQAAYLSHPSGDPPVEFADQSSLPVARSAVDRSTFAAGRLLMALLDRGNRVGLASFGPRRSYLSPGVGTDHAVRAKSMLADTEAFSPQPPGDQSDPVIALRSVIRQLPDDVQLVFLTPLCDDEAETAARRIDARGYPVTVLSPDPTSDGTIGWRIAFIERRLRLTALRRHDIPVVNWGWDQPLAGALRTVERRQR